ncbi:protein CFAP276-like [Corticium candelabrum]|uniref:protein CFAP276-like n=1 Tax=Corticium candelabrum TaxID=121492 RepID=UPI002E26A345|nr:protein CFAP276-like [Corticium candelabrum]
MSRNPYPFPRHQNDSDFTNAGKETDGCELHGKLSLSPGNNPWKRLNETATLTSYRRDAHHFDPLAPHDSLDFVLKTRYDHHNEFLHSKAETLIQPETVGMLNGRILKNRPTVEEFHNRREADYYEVKDAKKHSVNSIGGAIESHHGAATNRGYSRKHDGGFYTT